MHDDFLLRVTSASPYAASLVDAASGALVAEARETTAGAAALAARALARTELRQALPYEVTVAGLATLRRGLSVLRPEIEVLDAAGAPLATLRQRLWATGGAFEALDPEGRRIATLRLAPDGAATLEDPDGRALAWLEPAEGQERRLAIEEGLAPQHRAVVLAVMAALDRILAG